MQLQEGHAFVCSILNRVEAHEVAELPSVEDAAGRAFLFFTADHYSV